MRKRLCQLISWIESFRFTKATELYPEVKKAGGLGKALDIAFEEINSQLRVSNDKGGLTLPFSYARVEKGKRFSQIYMAVKTKLYLSDYWRDGVCLTHGSSNDLVLLAKSLHLWLDSQIATSQLAKEFSFIDCDERATAFDDGKEIQYAWNSYLNNPEREDLRGFIKLAMADEILGRLFPFTSLSRLCFSVCTGYPYKSEGIPIVVPIGNNKYEVRLKDDESLAIGNAEEALKTVKDNLPPGIKPAVKGTADDL